MRLLDLGCGPGRHSIELARLGYTMTGVDRTACYLDHARERALTEGLDIEFVQESMLRFVREHAFDGAINLLTSFGYFEDPADDLRVLKNILGSLKAGARVVLDVAGKEFLARSNVRKHWQEVGKGRYWLMDREVLPGWGKMRAHWVFVGNGELSEFLFEHRLYSAQELADLMKQAGFADILIYGGLDGRPYDLKATRLVVVGRKA